MRRFELPADGIRLVVVTGPQRSGTRFTATAIARDLGWQLVDEMDFGVHSLRRWRAVITTGSEAVIQCPAMMRHVHDDIPDDVLVVVMRRDVDDIIASQERIGWDENNVELARGDRTEGIASQVKYEHWDAHKHDAPAHWLEVPYESMADHPLWVAPELRKGFAFNQVAL